MHRTFGLIGKKLGHSFSKKYFSEKFAREGIDATYELYELADISEFPLLLERVPSLCGLNVTIPYKQDIIPYLARLSPAAAAVGAVNTVLPSPEGLIGHNTDTFGFQQSLKSCLPAAVVPSAAVVLGTGGAAKAVGYVLEEDMGVPHCLYVSRQPRGERQISYAELHALDLAEFPLIVNTTPLGMYPRVEDAPDFPYLRLGPAHLVMDLIYNPPETEFLRRARAQGATIENGMTMLVQQAEKSWAIWNQHEQTSHR